MTDATMTEIEIDDDLTDEAESVMRDVAEALAEMTQRDHAESKQVKLDGEEHEPEREDLDADDADEIPLFTEIIVEAMDGDAVLNAVYNGTRNEWFSLDEDDWEWRLSVQAKGEKAESYGPAVYQVMAEAGLAKPEDNPEVGVQFRDVQDTPDYPGDDLVFVQNVLEGGAN